MIMGLYKKNKKAQNGTIIECPICHTKFKKIQYSQAFCCIKCKDKFHNNHDGDRHRYNYVNNQNPDNETDLGQFTDLDLGTHDK